MSDIHWDSGASTPTYGNYGGENWSEGRIGPSTNGNFAPDKAPIDALDWQFFQHDVFLHFDFAPVVADKILLDGMVGLNDSQLDPEAIDENLEGPE